MSLTGQERGGRFLVMIKININKNKAVINSLPGGSLPGVPGEGGGPACRGAAPAPAPGTAGTGPAAPATSGSARRVARRRRQSEVEILNDFTGVVMGGGGGRNTSVADPGTQRTATN